MSARVNMEPFYPMVLSKYACSMFFFFCCLGDPLLSLQWLDIVCQQQPLGRQSPIILSKDSHER